MWEWWVCKREKDAPGVSDARSCYHPRAHAHTCSLAPPPLFSPPSCAFSFALSLSIFLSRSLARSLSLSTAKHRRGCFYFRYRLDTGPRARTHTRLYTSQTPWALACLPKPSPRSWPEACTLALTLALQPCLPPSPPTLALHLPTPCR